MLFLTISLFPSKKKGEEEKENELAKPILNNFFFRIDLKFTKKISNFKFIEIKFTIKTADKDWSKKKLRIRKIM